MSTGRPLIFILSRREVFLIGLQVVPGINFQDKYYFGISGRNLSEIPLEFFL
jgi:hypothetical protein